VSDRAIHLRPTTTLAERVLLPGDPGRALALAQHLLEAPLMFNHHRGLWGYTGTAPDGEPLTIQSTGMGGPSAAIVLEELVFLGARRAIRIGTCGALSDGFALGDLLIARESLAADGASRSLGAGELVAADPGLTAALERATEGRHAEARFDVDTAPATVAVESARRSHPGARIVSTDLFYEPDERREVRWRAAGAVAVEMEAATLFAVGARLQVPVACALIVSDLLVEGRQRIDDDSLLSAAEAMGRVATAALSS
jgi:uridine phosphorylase